jgi:uncharacterized protein (TIGR03000 family)
MYSIVLATLLTAGGEATPAWGRHHGCRGCYGCWGSCYGCWGGCYGCGGCSGCWGASCGGCSGYYYSSCCGGSGYYYSSCCGGMPVTGGGQGGASGGVGAQGGGGGGGGQGSGMQGGGGGQGGGGEGEAGSGGGAGKHAAEVKETLNDLKKSIEELKKEQDRQRLEALKRTAEELRIEAVEQKINELRRDINELKKAAVSAPPPGPPAPPKLPSPLPLPAPRTTPQGPAPRTGTVELRLPAVALLHVNGQHLPLAPVFSTPPLEPGKDHFYDFEVDTVIDGKAVTRVKRVAVRTGQVVRLAFADMDTPRSRLAETAGAPARLTVRLPADAQLKIQGELCPLTGNMREFDTPPLAPGRPYSYRLEADIVRNGQTITQTRRIEFRSGDRIAVSFENLDNPRVAAR